MPTGKADYMPAVTDAALRFVRLVPRDGDGTGPLSEMAAGEFTDMVLSPSAEQPPELRGTVCIETPRGDSKEAVSEWVRSSSIPLRSADVVVWTIGEGVEVHESIIEDDAPAPAENPAPVPADTPVPADAAIANPTPPPRTQSRARPAPDAPVPRRRPRPRRASLGGSLILLMSPGTSPGRPLTRRSSGRIRRTAPLTR